MSKAEGRVREPAGCSIAAMSLRRTLADTIRGNTQRSVLERVPLDAGLSRRHFFDVIAGRKAASLAWVEAVASVLDVDAATLAGRPPMRALRSRSSSQPLIACVARTLRQVIALNDAPSIAALARIADVSRTHVHAVLAGRHNTRLDTLADLANGLAIAPWVFLVEWESASLSVHLPEGPIQRTVERRDGG